MDAFVIPYRRDLSSGMPRRPLV